MLLARLLYQFSCFYAIKIFLDPPNVYMLNVCMCTVGENDIGSLKMQKDF